MAALGRSLPVTAFDEHGKLKISVLMLAAVPSAIALAVSVFQTAIGGYESPWWILAGIFLWFTVMLPIISGMARLQRRASSEESPFPPVGGKYAGPIVVLASVLFTVGLVGFLNVLALVICAAEGSCAPVPIATVVAIASSVIVGGALLGLVFAIAARDTKQGLRTGAR